jgi:hypothetical protein
MNTDFDRKYRKAAQRLKLMSRLRPHLNAKAATKIYTMMIIPIIMYCCQLHSSITAINSKKLTSISDRATRIIKSQDAKLPGIEMTMKIRNCLFVRKCLDKLVCENFHDYFKINNRNIKTRNSLSLLALPRVRLEIERKAFYFYGAKQYNELPSSIRNDENFDSFKSSLIQMT